MKAQGRFVPLESNRAYHAKLTKLRIPGGQFAQMRSELDRFNVNESTLFPDVDGICGHIQWLNSFLEDETGVGNGMG
jgi:hypothetical protein